MFLYWKYYGHTFIIYTCFFCFHKAFWWHLDILYADCLVLEQSFINGHITSNISISYIGGFKYAFKIKTLFILRNLILLRFFYDDWISIYLWKTSVVSWSLMVKTAYYLFLPDFSCLSVWVWAFSEVRELLEEKHSWIFLWILIQNIAYLHQ